MKITKISLITVSMLIVSQAFGMTARLARLAPRFAAKQVAPRFVVSTRSMSSSNKRYGIFERTTQREAELEKLARRGAQLAQRGSKLAQQAAEANRRSRDSKVTAEEVTLTMITPPADNALPELQKDLACWLAKNSETRKHIADLECLECMTGDQSAKLKSLQRDLETYERLAQKAAQAIRLHNHKVAFLAKVKADSELPELQKDFACWREKIAQTKENIAFLTSFMLDDQSAVFLRKLQWDLETYERLAQKAAQAIRSREQQFVNKKTA